MNFTGKPEGTASGLWPEAPLVFYKMLIKVKVVSYRSHGKCKLEFSELLHPLRQNLDHW